VTGGAGFIGSNFVLDWLAASDEPVVNLDCLSYAGNLENLAALAGDARHVFVRGDICDLALVTGLLGTYRPRAVVHFAAETHVDRSIRDAAAFVRANVEGTYTLLEAVHGHFDALCGEERSRFRFIHVSTDEVYGSLDPAAPAFDESARYAPSSPYAASKAASDHFARAWHRTYGLPVIITNCSNNYGPFQLPEKLIPLMIVNGLAGKPMPIYGDGLHVRDWLHVADHCAALRAVLERGRVGETYNIGGGTEQTSLEIVGAVCGLLDELRPAAAGSYRRLITHVADRPGHDRRYAIDAAKIARELSWRPGESLRTGLRKTVGWYLDHPEWLAHAQSGAFRQWIETQYGRA
jgi:dTDP-glucose 4,6-dehydratase